MVGYRTGEDQSAGVAGNLQPVSGADDRLGSKPVSLEVSKCFPLRSPKRTSDLRDRDMSMAGVLARLG
jgi:hypothetical protein